MGGGGGGEDLTQPSHKQFALATQILQRSSLNKKQCILNYGKMEVFHKSRLSPKRIFPINNCGPRFYSIASVPSL